MNKGMNHKESKNFELRAFKIQILYRVGRYSERKKNSLFFLPKEQVRVYKTRILSMGSVYTADKMLWILYKLAA